MVRKAVVQRILALLFAVATGSPAFAQDVVTISGTITTAVDEAPVPGAIVSVADASPAITATAGENGRYTLAVPRSLVRYGRVQIRVDALGLPAKTVSVRIDGDAVRADVVLTIGFAEQVVVGSRATGADAERAVPVDVLTHDQITATGFTETAQVIASLAPSFNFPRPSITDGTDTVRPATLRGLGPDQVLVLVNGKRRHQSALVHLNGSVGRGSTGVDLNAIPLSAIDRIEILRDGASAQYGSDAIAGVLNIVLKGGVADAQVTSEFGLSKGSFAGNQCTPDGRSCSEGDDISFSDGGLADVGGSWGIAVGAGSVTVAAEYRHHNRTNRASFDPRDQIVAGDAGTNAVAEPNHRWGDPDTRDVMTFVNAILPVNPEATTTVYAFGGYSRREANSAGFYRRALDARNWPQIYPLGFLPEIRPEVVDVSGAGGLRGAIRAWTYDFSAGGGHNSFAYAVGNSLNSSLGPSMPPNKTLFDAGTLELNQFFANADVSRTLTVKGFARPVNLAFGAEVRYENYQIHAGEPDSYRDGGSLNQAGGPPAIGAQVFPGFRPSNEVNKYRSGSAGYVDFEGDLTPRLRIGAAVRGEHYWDDVGGTVDGKGTGRLQAAKFLILRASVSSGFRAPSLGQSYFSSTATNFLNLGQGLVPVESLTLPVDSPAAKALGALPLKPERSRNISAGVVVVPARDLDVAVDYYNIAIDNRIVLSGNFTAAPIAELLAPFGANSARFFTNAIDTRTEGVDAVATYRAKLASGDLNLRAAYNHTRTRIRGPIVTPPQLAAYASVLFDHIEQNRLQCGQPDDNLRLNASWRRHAFGLNLNEGRYGSVCSFASQNPADDQHYAPKWLTDVEASLQRGGYRVGVGVQNLFNVLPDRNTPVNSFNGIQTFPSQSPFGFNGRALYTRLAWKF